MVVIRFPAWVVFFKLRSRSLTLQMIQCYIVNLWVLMCIVIHWTLVFLQRSYIVSLKRRKSLKMLNCAVHRYKISPLIRSVSYISDNGIVHSCIAFLENCIIVEKYRVIGLSIYRYNVPNKILKLAFCFTRFIAAFSSIYEENLCTRIASHPCTVFV